MEKSTEKKVRKKTRLGSLITYLFSFLFIVPVFILVHKYVPNLKWFLYLDRVILFIIISAIIIFLFRKIRAILIIAFFLMVVYFTYGSIVGDYGFSDVYDDYKTMLFNMNESPNPEEIIVEKLQPFPNKFTIENAVDYTNSDVRNFSLQILRKHFLKDQQSRRNRIFVQSCAIFKEINSKWNYVHDPSSREYYAKASESIKHLSGDCDDHSILMVACIKAIGGKTRIVHTPGHMYPELYIGHKSELENVVYLLRNKLFTSETKGELIHYHIDNTGKIWLNLDYTANYPGGKFMNEEVLSVLNVD